MGLGGLLLAMALEGSSLPFPGMAVVLAFGYALQPDLAQLPIIALLMSLAYTGASYIAYGIGRKMEQQIRKRYAKPLDKAQKWFCKYGDWSIALLRPFGLGNYVSYIGGMSRVHPVKYGIYTLMGIYPWSLAMLWLGRVSRGGGEVVKELLWSHRCLLVTVLAVIVAIGVAVLGTGRPLTRKSSPRQPKGKINRVNIVEAKGNSSPSVFLAGDGILSRDQLPVFTLPGH